MDFPISLPAIKVSQPFGDFFITRIPAEILLETTYKDPLRVRDKKEETYSVMGKQRSQRIDRLKEIGAYINSVDAAFPNSIILSANFYEKGTAVSDFNKRWRIEKDGNKECISLIIPSSSKIVSIIDGQHRVDAFNYADENRKKIEMLCCVYLDLPETYQAYLFATINYNQKPVSKALAYELFGASLEEEPTESWSPEKTAIFLTRKLNVSEESPLKNHIIVAAQQDDLIEEKKINTESWAISTSTVVDGIMKLYSQNPKRDKSEMHNKRIGEGRERKILPDDNTPLRSFYKNNNDLVIFTTVFNYFNAADQLLFKSASRSSYIKKTVGVQALFDILKEILKREFEVKKDISVNYFSGFLGKVKDVDFSDSFFQASGVGKSRIKNTIALANKFITQDEIRSENDLKNYTRLLGHS